MFFFLKHGVMRSHRRCAQRMRYLPGYIQKMSWVSLGKFSLEISWQM